MTLFFVVKILELPVKSPGSRGH